MLDAFHRVAGQQHLQNLIEQARLRLISVTDAAMPRRQISLIFRKNRKHTRAVHAFLTLIAELYEVTIPEAALSGVA